MRKLAPVLLLILLCSSCYTYHVFPRADRKFTYSGERKAAIILNPELAKEAAIFNSAGIFRVADNIDSNITRIVLLPLRKKLACGSGMGASILFLGQLPVHYTDHWLFDLQEINGRDTTLKQFDLKIAQRVWFWDMFVFKKNFEGKAGQALLATYYRNTGHENK